MLILKKSGGIFDPENLKNEIDNLEKKTFENDFWNRKDSKEILKNLNNKKKLLEEYDILKNSYEEVDTIGAYVYLEKYEAKVGAVYSIDKLTFVVRKVEENQIRTLEVWKEK